MSGPGNPVDPDPERIEALFAAAAELPPGAREALLTRDSAGDAALRAAVEELLATHDRDAGALPALDAERAADLLRHSVAEAEVAQKIGPYRIVKPIGRGGMGVVYLGERTSGGFEQRVALKLIHKGLDSEAIVDRFRRERQILARLDHPGIARLLDGGMTEDGRPYFAMEYVEGEPVTDYASHHELGVDELLLLLLQVCDAVQRAHRDLVIHRDLKPSNILVSNEGRVKLVDFGIAKLLAGSGDESPFPETRFEGRALTPEYASPEQVRGEPVTTASDVYGLGVVAYELLTGRLPYDGPLSTPSQIERAVCETEPPLASEAARGVESGVRPEDLARRLRGDLDAILSRALAKEVDRRYPSVEALAEELRRHLAGLPVQARAPGFAYRAGKFVRRHRAGVALATALLAALVLGLVGTAWQATVAARERDRAAAQAAKAEAVQDFLVSLLESVDPYRTAGAPWTADQLLDRGVERLAAARAAGPRVEADLLGVLGGVSLSLGQLDRAEELWRRSLALRRESFAAGSAEIAEGLRGLAAVLYDRDEHEETARLLEEALEIERGRADASGDQAPPERLALARTLEQLGVERHEVGRHDEARALYEEGLAILRSLPGDRRAGIAQMLANLAGLHQAAGELELAEPLQREAVAIEREVLGARHPGLAVTLNNLAITLRRRGDLDGAESVQREALAISRAALGEEHPEVTTKLSNLAFILRARGEFEEAAELFRQSLALDRKLLGDEHVYVAFSMDNLASVLAELGRFDEAFDLFDRAAAILDAARGPESVESAVNRLARGAALRLAGRPRAALPLVEGARRIFEEQLGADHPRTVAARNELATLQAELANHLALGPTTR